MNHARCSYPCLAAAALMVAALAVPARAADLVLVQDGAPQATIVVAQEALGAPTEPTPQTYWSAQPATNKIAAAARDLQEYVEKMSGAKLPIAGDQQDPGGAVILVGRSKLTARYNAKIPSGLTPPRREEGFLLLTDGNRLVLAGNDAGPYHGSEYAVAAFLGRLGVRWFMPGEYGEIVPPQRTVRVPRLNVTAKPDFPLRNWWGPMTMDLRQEEYRWKIRMGANPVLDFLTIPRDSSTRGYLPPDQIKADPSLAGQKADGSLNDGMPNLTNPKSVALFADAIKEQFRKDSNLTSAAFAPDDGIPVDWTPATRKLNLGLTDVGGRAGVPTEQSVSEEWFDFVNRVTAEVKKEFPDHLIGSNGYANRNTPPVGMTLDPNVYVMFAAIWSDTLHAYDNPRSWMTLRQGEMLKRWAELCPNVYMYNYTYYMLASGGSPIPLARKHARDFPLLKKWGIIGFSDEGRRVLMESGVGPSYLRARLMWDADLDVNAVMDEFYHQWYGGAAAPARAFWDALEQTIETTPLLGHEDRILPYVYSPELIRELEKQVAAAKKLADTDRVRQHVRADELILNHLKGYLAMTAAEWKADFAQAVRQADYMLAQRRELAALSRFYTQPDDETSASGFYYWGIVARKKYYQRLADLTSGKTGTLVAKLPDKTRFKLDPRDDGRFANWADPKLQDRDWAEILTTKPFYLQVPGGLDDTGYPYMGALWYRFDVSVPGSARGKKVMLYAPTVETEAWVWVNGQFVGHRPFHEAYERPNEIDLDVTDALQPGRSNSIVVRVHTGLGPAAMAGGFYSRLFLYSPKP
ncbi:DUF4838 domain-containing protein [bacterium]|nr:DUF4838 domain-containing protein [bacterium]